MGQKINTNSLFIGKRLSWEAVWCDTGLSFANNLTDDFEVKYCNTYITKSLGFLNSNLLLRRNNNRTILYNKLLHQRYLASSINFSQLEVLKKKRRSSMNLLASLKSNCLLSFFNYKESDKNRFLNTSFSSKFSNKKNILPFMVAQSLSDYIAEQFELSLKKKDFFFKMGLLQGLVRFTKRLINKSNYIFVSGILIKCSGKWTKTRTGRKQKLSFSVGHIMPKGASSVVSYGFSNIATKHGACGIKVWISYNII